MAKKSGNSSIRYFSLFSGIGGFEIGIGKLGQSVGYSEIDKYAIQIYEKHFNHKNFGDITAINELTIPDFDLLVGGFPCQSFSIAGKRGGFNDTRGTLFFDIARLLKSKQPKFFVLENVKGLLSHDSGRTFKTIISTLDELGYDLQWQVLNSKNFGVPQNRERVFIVGHTRGVTRPEVFPFAEGNSSHDREEGAPPSKGQRIRGQDISSSITANYYKGAGGSRQMIQVGVIGKDSEATRVYDTAGIARTIKNGGGMGAKTGLYITQRGRGKNGGGVHKIAPALTGNSYVDNNHVQGIRRLTPIECERLQGFPDNWTQVGIQDGKEVIISDTQRYKCLGNAVTVNVIKAIMERLLK